MQAERQTDKQTCAGRRTDRQAERQTDQGCYPPEQKKIPDFSLTVKQFSLTMQDDYTDHESTKIRKAQIRFKTKLICLYKNNDKII